MYCRIAVALVVSLSFTRSAGAQSVTTEALRSIRVDSLVGQVPVYYSSGISAQEAAELQQLAQGCITKYRDTVGGIPSVTLAVLDSASWTRLTRAPYGFPHHNPFSSPVVIVVPATAAGTFAGAVPPARANRFFRLLALHELGHVLTFASVGADPRSAGMPPQWPIPGWYLEFAASYFGLSCMAPADREAGITAEWLRSNRPAFTLLDEAAQLHEKQTADGRPYLMTTAYFLNVAWYQGVLEEAARHQLQHLGDGFTALLREQWHRASGSNSTEAVVNDLMRSNPNAAAWLRSIGAIR